MNLLDCDDLNGLGELQSSDPESTVKYAVRVLDAVHYTITDKQRLLEVMPRLVPCLGPDNLACLFEALRTLYCSESTLVLMGLCKALPVIAQQVVEVGAI
jgi:hypothetical protein